MQNNVHEAREYYKMTIAVYDTLFTSASKTTADRYQKIPPDRQVD